MAEHAREFTVAADHPCLAGHFPGNPVVPAVMLLEFVAQALADALGRGVRVSGVPAAKFSAPLLPEQVLRVVLDIDEAAPRGASHSARFRLTRDGVELGTGRVDYVND